MSALWASGLACASAPPKTNPSRRPSSLETEARQSPLTVEEAEKIIRESARRLRVCYSRERLNSREAELSDYILQMQIPNDGSGPKVRVVEATVPGQAHLEDCVKTTVARIKFPVHQGEPIIMNVPIEGPE